MICTKKTKGGKPCKAQAMKDSKFCFIHDPASAKDRAAARKLGGERTRTPHAGDPNTIPKQIRSMDDLRKVFDYVVAEVIPMENSIPRGRLLLAVVEQGTKLFEVGELEARIEALERAAKKV